MIIAFDLDDVLCVRDVNVESLGHEKYLHCSPIQDMIDVVNACYDDGHYIKIYTARGMSHFNKDIKKILEFIKPITEASLKQWNVKHHELIFGKEHYDVLIDDKAFNSNTISSIKDIENLEPMNAFKKSIGDKA